MRGIVTVLNTPFTDRDAVDVTAVQLNVRNAIDAGVAGFLVPAMAGEVGRLTAEERDALVAVVCETTGGTVPVIGGASADTAAERRRRAENLVAAGCDGVLVSLSGDDPDPLGRELEELAALGPGFLMLQDWDAHGAGIPVPTLIEVVNRVPALTWLKIEVPAPGPKYSALMAALGDRVQVAGGWAVLQMIEALDRGVHAFMPTALHTAYATLYRRYAAGDRDAAQALFNELLPILAFSNQRLDISIRFFKRLLWRQGVFTTERTRLPDPGLDPIQTRIADELIERAIAIESPQGGPGYSARAF